MPPKTATESFGDYASQFVEQEIFNLPDYKDPREQFDITNLLKLRNVWDVGGKPYVQMDDESDYRASYDIDNRNLLHFLLNPKDQPVDTLNVRNYAHRQSLNDMIQELGHSYQFGNLSAKEKRKLIKKKSRPEHEELGDILKYYLEGSLENTAHSFIAPILQEYINNKNTETTIDDLYKLLQQSPYTELGEEVVMK